MKANRLRERRKAAGMSQRQLAAASRVNVRIIQKCEEGVTSINKVQLLHVIKLAKALKCSPSDLAEVEE